MKMENKKYSINRREFLKRLGLGTAITTTALAGCKSATTTDESDVPTDKMTYRTNHNTGDKVSILGYGCMRWPRKKTGKNENELDQEAINELVDYALEHGVNFFDTAPVYCQGRSEAATGIALKRHPRNKYFIATKLSNFSNSSRENSILMYKRSMELLQVDYIDYYLLHSLGGKDDFHRRYLDNGILDYLMEERKAGRI
ncbi:MAG: aldo/keto reductase, partial [Alistipes sp.]|nr:aldo/keto reductase [Alistipes sp.]